MIFFDNSKKVLFTLAIFHILCWKKNKGWSSLAVAFILRLLQILFLFKLLLYLRRKAKNKNNDKEVEPDFVLPLIWKQRTKEKIFTFFRKTNMSGVLLPYKGKKERGWEFSSPALTRIMEVWPLSSANVMYHISIKFSPFSNFFLK